MNKDIKFRIWVPKFGKYLQKYINSDNDGKRIVEVFNSLHTLPYMDSSEYVVQQYIGLKDKNNEDIYEGDIVILQQGGIGGFSDIKHVCEIFTKKTETSAYFYHARPLPICDVSRQFGLYGNQYEIIGNIFENPEFLDEETADNYHAIKISTPNRLISCDNCKKKVNIELNGGKHDDCDFIYGRRGWRQLGAYDG